MLNGLCENTLFTLPVGEWKTHLERMNNFTYMSPQCVKVGNSLVLSQVA